MSVKTIERDLAKAQKRVDALQVEADSAAQTVAALVADVVSGKAKGPDVAASYADAQALAGLMRDAHSQAVASVGQLERDLVKERIAEARQALADYKRDTWRPTVDALQDAQNERRVLQNSGKAKREEAAAAHVRVAEAEARMQLVAYELRQLEAALERAKA